MSMRAARRSGRWPAAPPAPRGGRRALPRRPTRRTSPGWRCSGRRSTILGPTRTSTSRPTSRRTRPWSVVTATAGTSAVQSPPRPDVRSRCSDPSPPRSSGSRVEQRGERAEGIGFRDELGAVDRRDPGRDALRGAGCGWWVRAQQARARSGRGPRAHPSGRVPLGRRWTIAAHPGPSSRRASGRRRRWTARRAGGASPTATVRRPRGPAARSPGGGAGRWGTR